MSDFFQSKVIASAGSPPFNGFDSILEKPSGDNLSQNAWLTLQLRVRLNFVDSKNPVAGMIVTQGSTTFAKDFDGYLFPILDWPPHLVAKFQSDFVRVAESTWNYQFILQTPKTYSGLDVSSNVGSGWIVRPNVLCLFRLSIQNAAGPIDTSPAAGPLAMGAPHRTINVVNLSLGTKQVSLAPGIAPTPVKPQVQTIPKVEGLSFRSDAFDYDDRDLFAPAWRNVSNNVMSNTVGHEVGHALGQSHIMGLKGLAAFKIGGAQSNTPAAYGVGSGDPLDDWNIMGGGDRVYLINAVSWQERIAIHTGVAANLWTPTGNMGTPPRKMALGASLVSPLPEW